MKLDEHKLEQLPTFNSYLDDKYGRHGTAGRAAFDADSLAWYYGDILRDRRKALKLTQKQVAEKVGKEQSYIARVEKGEVDIHMSSFLKIAKALGIQFAPVYL